MNYVQELTLDFNSNAPYVTVGTKQGDTGCTLKIHITNNNEPFDIPNTYSATFRCRKPDGHGVVLSCDIETDSNNEKCVMVDLTAETLRVSGRGYADIAFSESGEVISTIPFILIIVASPDIGHDVVSTDDFSALVDVLAQTEDLVETMNTPWVNMQVSASSTAYTAAASVTGTYDQSTASYSMVFSIPVGAPGAAGTAGATGERGPSTVWYGTSEPTGADSSAYTVWVNPEGADNSLPYIIDAGDVAYSATASYPEGDNVGYLLQTLDINRVMAAAETVYEFVDTVDDLIATVSGKQDALPTNTTNTKLYLASVPNENTSEYQLSVVDYNELSNIPSIQAVDSQGNSTVYEIKGSNTPVQLGIAPANIKTSDGSYYSLPAGQTLISEQELDSSVKSLLHKESDAIAKIVINGVEYRTNAELSNTVDLTNSFTAVLQPQTNYLDNAFFTIQQRIDSKTQGFVTGDFVCDRWKVTAIEGGSIGYQKGLIELNSPTDAATAIVISQIVPDSVIDTLESNTVTISVRYSETRTGADSYLSKTKPSFADNDEISIAEGDGTGLQIKLSPNNNENNFGHYSFDISIAGHSTTLSRYIRAVKIEIGNYNTLTVDAAPLYTKELNNCQKYYAVLTNPLTVDDVPASASAKLDCFSIGQGVARASGLFGIIYAPSEMVQAVPLVLSVYEVQEEGYAALTSGLSLVQANSTNAITASFPTDIEIHGYSLGLGVSVVLSAANTTGGYNIGLPTNQILVVDSQL